MQNESIERAILSSVLFDPRLLDECILKGLKSEHFFSSFRQELYKTFILLQEVGIEEELIKTRMGDLFDEMEVLRIMSTNPISNIGSYVTELIKLANLRKLNRMALEILDKTSNITSFEEISKTLHQGIEALDTDASSMVTIYGIDTIQAKEAEFYGKQWLPFPKRAVSLVTAGGGVGKSFLLMQCAMRMIKEDGVKVFMWLSEDPVELSRHRFELIAKEIMNDLPSDYAEKLHIAGSDSETIHFLEEERGKVSINAAFFQFKKLLAAYDVIILDPLIAMFGGDENNNTHARQFVNLFTRWATTEGKTIIFIHHGTKNSAQSRGASAFIDAVRLVYQVEIIKNQEGKQIENDLRLITLAKDNNGAKKYLDTFQVKRKVFPKKKSEVILEFNL